MSVRPRWFQRRPTRVLALQWRPDDPAAVGAMIGWLMAAGCEFRHPSGSGGATTLEIVTLEGPMLVAPGSWVIRGVAGEFYPCRGDIFAETYGPIEADE